MHRFRKRKLSPCADIAYKWVLPQTGLKGIVKEVEKWVGLGVADIFVNAVAVLFQFHRPNAGCTSPRSGRVSTVSILDVPLFRLKIHSDDKTVLVTFLYPAIRTEITYTITQPRKLWTVQGHCLSESVPVYHSVFYMSNMSLETMKETLQIVHHALE